MPVEIVTQLHTAEVTLHVSSAQAQIYACRHGAPEAGGDNAYMPRKNYIREWRERRGWNQDQLAEAAGTTAATVSRYEKGRLGYTQKKLEGLADALKCQPGDLLLHDPGSSAYQLWSMLMSLDEDQLKRARNVLAAHLDIAIDEPEPRRPLPKPTSSRSRAVR